MEWIAALVSADALKLALLIILAVAVAAALFVWKMKHPAPSKEQPVVPVAIIKLIDERATHKVSSAVTPLTGRVADLEGDMRDRETESRDHRDRIIRMESDALHTRATIEESQATVTKIFDRMNDTDGKLNRIMGHLGVKTREDG